MITKTFTAINKGLDVNLIEVETDISPGLPAIVIVGLPSKAVQESKERIRSAMKESGYDFPLGKVTINLAPADLLKTGSNFDLPISICLLQLTGYIPNNSKLPIDLDKTLILGELALNGDLRPVKGVLSACLWAKKNNWNNIIIPQANQEEAALVKGINIFCCQNLQELTEKLNKIQSFEATKTVDYRQFQKSQKRLKYQKGSKTQKNQVLQSNDLAYIKGQEKAKRALEIAASGGHNLLLIGSPGSGKTLLARSYPTILPEMTEEEVLEATQIYSVAGLLNDKKIIIQRPFRAPHHSASHVALVGGSSQLKPGEISLAHRGVLFLDEFPEFSREALEALRQPLEDGLVQISRANGTVIYPAKFYLIAAANPTPSGFSSRDPQSKKYLNNQASLQRYRAKFSGPIIDRIDICVEVNQPKTSELQDNKLSESSQVVATRVQSARDCQTKRFARSKITCNAEMNLPLIHQYCQLGLVEEKLMAKATEEFQLSARSYIRILKLARTIADLDNQEIITTKYLAEALQYRYTW